MKFQQLRYTVLIRHVVRDQARRTYRNGVCLPARKSHVLVSSSLPAQIGAARMECVRFSLIRSENFRFFKDLSQNKNSDKFPWAQIR